MVQHVWNPFFVSSFNGGEEKKHPSVKIRNRRHVGRFSLLETSGRRHKFNTNFFLINSDDGARSRNDVGGQFLALSFYE